ncbi:hypothetical protein D9Q98_007129 [Chlorella vulgaris]|uniref:RRM domain-containing protein n=1 Tax=Chlorella vulgaris TaxID=3077 RepID=A0A9D4TJJ9_CHLVU|nr:hypothetical protein D9Q98_007129 [Chlorella vulgaris]
MPLPLAQVPALNSSSAVYVKLSHVDSLRSRIPSSARGGAGSRSCDRRSNIEAPSAVLWVGGLPPTARADAVAAVFGRFGSVVSCHLQTANMPIPSPPQFAILELKERREAQALWKP